MSSVFFPEVQEILWTTTIEIVTRIASTKRSDKWEKRRHYIISIGKEQDGEVFDYYDSIQNYNREQERVKKSRIRTSYQISGTIKKQKKKFSLIWWRRYSCKCFILSYVWLQFCYRVWTKRWPYWIPNRQSWVRI